MKVIKLYPVWLTIALVCVVGAIGIAQSTTADVPTPQFHLLPDDPDSAFFGPPTKPFITYKSGVGELHVLYFPGDKYP